MKSILNYVPITENHKSHVAMLLVQLIYAGMALLSKAAIAKGMNPYVFVVYRQAFATVFLAPFAFFLESGKPPLSYKMIFKIFLLTLWLTLSLNLFYVAIHYTTATFASATTNTIPVLTLVIALLLRMERISLRKFHGIAKVFGSVISVSGALVFAFVKGPPMKFMQWYPETQNQNPKSSIKASSIEDLVKGSLLMIAANISWSIWIVLQGPTIRQYPAKIRLTTLQCFLSCIQCVFWAILMERHPSVWKLGWDLHLLSVAYCGVIVTGITYWLQLWVIEKKGPVFTAIFTPLSLIVTAIFSAFLSKETLRWGSVGGAVLLIAGLYSVLWGKKKEENKSLGLKEQNLENDKEISMDCISTNH